MVPSGNNILDMLSGTIEGLPSQQSGDATGLSVTEGALFGDILSLFFSGKAPDLDLLAAKTEASAVADGGSELQKLSGQLLVTEAETKTAIVAEVLNLTGRSDQAAALNPKFHALFNQESVELKSGSYQVLDLQITEGRLLLTLQFGDSGARPIEIVIPAEMLFQSSENVRQGGGMTSGIPGMLSLRAAGEKAGGSTPKIEKLFADLNLKSLEISKVPNNTVTEPAQEKVQVKIIAENSGSELVIKANLSKEQLNIKSADKPSPPPSMKGGTGSTVESVTDQDRSTGSHAESNPDYPQNSASRTTGQRAAVPIKNHPWAREFSLIDKLENPETIQQANEPKTVAGSQTTDINMSEHLSGNRSLSSSVRISLPENAVGNLKVNGKSIMIRIEPDHLGPIRLNLVLRGEALTARVTVETVQAQIAIENSVDKLTEQLSRAGIKVEHVEVNLSGEDMRRQFMDRRTSWHRPKRFQRLSVGDDRHVEGLSSPMIPMPHSTGYLNREGVNLYA